MGYICILRNLGRNLKGKNGIWDYCYELVMEIKFFFLNLLQIKKLIKIKFIFSKDL